MNKITQKLLGTASALALVAGCGVAPAFAGGVFQSTGSATFSYTPNTTFSLTGANVGFLDYNTNTITDGLLSLSGGTYSSVYGDYTGTSLIFTPTGGGMTVNESGTANLAFSGSGASRTVHFGNDSSFGTGDDLDLGPYVAPATTNNGGFNGPVNPVPEASTVVSFGALIALGALAVLRRKSVKNVA